MGLELLLALGILPRNLDVMPNPLWMLVPWAVFALAAGLKFWGITTMVRKHLLGIPSRTERFRQGLERTWIKEHLTP
jgi:hypothetical protein